MSQPSTISGTAVSADTSGDSSIVTVAIRYKSDGLATAPPSSARIKVLVVKRDGSWWAATPYAFNPLHPPDGGLSEAELRDQHEELLAATKSWFQRHRLLSK